MTLQLEDELKTRGNKSELQNRLEATVLLETEHGEGEESEEETDDDDYDQNLHLNKLLTGMSIYCKQFVMLTSQ